MIPFNRQNLFGKEFEYIQDAYAAGKLSGDGKYTRLCSEFMEKRFHVNKVLLTTSGTHALEMPLILIDLREGDEVILPSYTFVSTVNAIVLRGATPVFCEIREDNLNIDETKIEALITAKTKAIMPVHYAGVACEMDTIMALAEKYQLFVIEDAAQAIDAKYKDLYLGTIGDFGAFSFHETKNISMGEGGALLINNPDFVERAEIVREKGTNRSQFFRGEVDKYTWVDIGSSYLPSEINAAVLYHQLENIDLIMSKRKALYNRYHDGLKFLEDEGILRLPVINNFAMPNYHIFYILLNSENTRNKLMSTLKSKGIYAVFHYIPLHTSTYYKQNYDTVSLPVTEKLSACLLRLPMFFSLGESEIDYCINTIVDFFKGNAE